jgi:hypothetical protein
MFPRSRSGASSCQEVKDSIQLWRSRSCSFDRHDDACSSLVVSACRTSDPIIEMVSTAESRRASRPHNSDTPNRRSKKSLSDRLMKLEARHSTWLAEAQVSRLRPAGMSSCHELRAPEPSLDPAPSNPSPAPSPWGTTKTARQDPPPHHSGMDDSRTRAALVARKSGHSLPGAPLTESTDSKPRKTVWDGRSPQIPTSAGFRRWPRKFTFGSSGFPRETEGWERVVQTTNEAEPQGSCTSPETARSWVPS